MNVKVEGVIIKVGDWVGFKSDIEQSGKGNRIFSDGTLELYNENGFIGEYIGGDNFTDVDSEDFWL